MGTVYTATDRLTKQTVALKSVTVMTQHLQFASKMPSSDPRLALTLEFRTLAALRHPNIITVLDYGFDRIGQPYFTMQYLQDAVPLTQYSEPDDTETHIKLLMDVLRALIYLHRRGIVHRDLKPENVLVTTDGTARVLDFGLALETDQVTDDESELLVGTLPYMAPELFSEALPSVQSDLYAVGVMAFELFYRTTSIYE